MTEPLRYGRAKLTTILDDFDALRAAVKAHDSFAAEVAWDRFERWLGLIQTATPPLHTDTERRAMAAEAECERLTSLSRDTAPPPLTCDRRHDMTSTKTDSPIPGHETAQALVAEWLDEAEITATRRERMMETARTTPGLMEAWLITACEIGMEAVRADPAPAVRVKALQWEVLHSSHCYRAPAPLFGSIRVERYGEGPWLVQWSVPGICDQLIDAEFETAAAAMDAADAYVAAALAPAPAPGVERLVDVAQRAVSGEEMTGDAMADLSALLSSLHYALAAYEGEGRDG